jgi:tuberculosinol/isotuberculosinol synthase
MDKETFRDLPLTEFARLVRAVGPKVCVFPINGTRRWFMMEYPLSHGEDMASVYRDVAAKRHIELYTLFFEHGVDTLLTPIFGPDLLERGEAYTKMATEGLALLATHADFVEFYDAYQVRVRFYGDYREYFGATPHAYLADLFDEVTARTQSHDRHHAEHGCVPDKRDLVEMYYGEYVDPVDLFIGFDRFCSFDMPLVATGNEDLYFTVSPSPYLSERQLRDVLYDHLYSRRGGEPDYSALESDDWKLMNLYYRANMDKTVGVGVRRGQIWYPLPQVEIPSDFA